MENKLYEKKQAIDKEQVKESSEVISEEERIEAKIDRDLRDSFPASDPPGWTMGVEKRRVKKDED